MNYIARLAGSVIALALLASCGSTKNDSDAVRTRIGGLVAQLRSPSSAVTGAVHVYDARDGVQLQLTVNNLFPGQYRIAIHETGNCRSPNLFSAGPPWAPPGSAKLATDLLPGFLANNDGNQNSYVAFIPGVHTDTEPALRGKSVVLHWGTSVTGAFPGQPNNRIACGVLEWTESVF
jgi:Cu/Zn superoxide dismutase